ncbi:MAG: methyltransferase family protein [Chthoniobacterales bacterium]
MTLPSPALIGTAYFVSELLLSVTRRSRGEGFARQDQSTLRLIWIVIIASIVAGIYVARHWRGATLPHAVAFAWIGLVLFALGILLRWWSIVVLGRFFTVDVTIAADHEVVESGPYRWIRHPSYAGVLLAFVGFALTTGNWLALLVINIPILATFLHRMRVEERALINGIGEPYVDYMRRTKRLVPFVY